jgi:hypothetical protein
VFFAGKIPVGQSCRGNQTNTQQNFQDQAQIFFHGYSKKVIEKEILFGADSRPRCWLRYRYQRRKTLIFKQEISSK